MNGEQPSPSENRERKIAAAIRKLRKAEEELHTITGGKLDAVAAVEGAEPYLLREARGRLRESEAEQRRLAEAQKSILNALPDHIALLDGEGNIVTVNESWQRFGADNAVQSPEFGVGRNYLEISEGATGECAEEARAAAAGIRRVLRGEAREFSLEYPCHSPEEDRWFRLLATPLSESSLAGAVVMHVDITGQKQAEMKVERINRLYRVLSRTNEEIVRAVETTDLFRAVCRIAVEDGSFRMAAIIPFQTERDRVRPITFAGVGDGYFDEVRVDLADEQLSRGTIGTAMRTGRYDVCNDIAAEARMEPWKAAAMRRGFRSAGSFPVTEGGRNVAILVLLAEVPGYFQDEEVKLLLSVTSDISFAMDSFRNQEQRSRAEAEVRLAAEKLEEIVRIQQEMSSATASFSDLLTLMAERCQALTGAHGAAVEMIDDDAMVYQAASGAMARRLGFRLKRAGSLSGLAVAEGAVLYCSDTETDPRVDRKSCREIGLRSMVVAPLRHRQESIGVMKVMSKAPDGFNERDVNNIRILVDTLAGIIHRSRIEDRLRTSEQQYRLLFQANPHPMWTYDVDSLRFLAVNAAAVLSYGYTEAEFLSMTIADIRPREDVPAMVETVEGLWEGQKNTGFSRHIKKDGTVMDVETSSDAVIFDGRRARLVMANDVTSRLRGERELARTNRALKMLTSCNEALIHADDEHELLKRICQVAVETGGYRMAWVGYAGNDVEKSVTPMAHAGEESGYLAGMKISWDEASPYGCGPAGRAIRSGTTTVAADIFLDETLAPWRDLARQRGYRGIVFLPLRDGGHTFGVLGLYSAEVIQSSAEEIRLLEELASDLAFGIAGIRARAERRQADARLREQAALLDSAHEAIMVRDLEGRIVYWNKGAEKTYGWRSEEALGEKVSDFLHTDPSRFAEAHALFLARGEWEGEMVKRTKDGRHINVEVRWSLVRDAEGTPRAVLAINSDITEKKQMESQFLRMQRMESIGTLAGGIAHDLNNALAPIMMAIGVLKDQVTTPEGRQLLELMYGSAQHSADLVRQVLTFARGVEGQRVAVNPVHLLGEIQKIIHDTFPKDITFTLAPSHGVWMVTGDPTQLHQVLTNLCVNARDAMPHGGDLRVTTENIVLDELYVGMNPDSKPGPYVVIKVSDTGTGISQAIQDRIFEPFFTTKEVGKGTGLGLSTTQAIVKSHGGFIHLYSEVGKGATFKVYLPAATSEEAAKSAALDQMQLPMGSGQLILVVDDEEAVRKVAKTALERFGYRVMLANNGAQAIGLYAQHRADIDVVLTDMAMPVMDGAATIIALKQMDPKVKIIGSSGMAANGGVAKAIGAGVKHFVPKPYTAETMLKILAEVLQEEA